MPISNGEGGHVSAGGATIVRPDGVVAWRARGPAGRDELARAFATARNGAGTV
jgi:hypothetical protein